MGFIEFVFSMVFDLLIKFHGSPHVSSVNLMTCMGSLTLIAKMRPQFMGKVVAALETLHSKWQALNVMKMITTGTKNINSFLNCTWNIFSLERHVFIYLFLFLILFIFNNTETYFIKIQEEKVSQRNVFNNFKVLD